MSTTSISQYNTKGKLLARYSSISAAATLSETDQSHISKVARGKRSMAGGYTWKYYNRSLTPTSKFTPKNEGVRALDANGNLVAVFATPEIAATLLGTKAGSITKARGTKRMVGGYLWA